MKATPRLTLAAIKAAQVQMGRTCEHAQQIARLTKEERRDYETALFDVSIQLPAIIAALRARGLRVNQTSTHSHRHRRCVHCFGGKT